MCKSNIDPASRTGPVLLISLLSLAVSCLAPVQIARASPPGDSLQVAFNMQITEGLASPARIAVNSQDVVYVTDAARGNVCQYSPDGDFLGKFAVGNFPMALAVTSQNYLYVTDRVSGEIRLLDASGQLLRIIADDFELPSSAVVDDEDRLYVLDAKTHAVRVFAANGDELAPIGEGVLAFPTALAFDKKNFTLLVAEHGGLGIEDRKPMIHVFDKQGGWKFSFGQYGYKEGQFSRIQGIDVDEQGRVYVADTYQGVISVFSETGEYLARAGGYGTERGELRAPMDVALDTRGRLWVASMNNGSLEVYDVGEIATAVTETPAPNLPSRSELLQNYPNPFNPSTRVPFVLAKDSYVVIHIYNEKGQLIRKFDLGRRQAGSGAIVWDATDSDGKRVSSGIYLYEIRTDGFVAARRMLLLK